MVPAQPNQSLIDGLACLQALAGGDGPVGSRELARQLGLEPTRVNRLLKTLAAVGLAQQDERRKYHPGPGIHVLAAQALHGSRLLRDALPALESLHPLGLGVAMGVLWRDRVAYLYHWSPGLTSAQSIGRSGLFPAVESGLGLALLAEVGIGEARSRVGGAWSAALRDRLERARADGFACTPRALRHDRTVAIALNHDRAALGLAGRFPDRRIPGLVGALRAAVERIPCTQTGAPA